jgi:predicted small lipoprotein YifL
MPALPAGLLILLVVSLSGCGQDLSLNPPPAGKQIILKARCL